MAVFRRGLALPARPLARLLALALPLVPVMLVAPGQSAQADPPSMCRVVNVELTPDFNWAHRNHLHLEVTAGARWFMVH